MPIVTSLIVLPILGAIALFALRDDEANEGLIRNMPSPSRW